MLLLYAVNLHTKPCNMQPRLICLFIYFFVCVNLYSQDTLPSANALQKQISASKTLNKVYGLPSIPLSQNFLFASATAPVKTLPADYYYNSIGFFCRKELQVEKTLKVPFKLRLGDVNYTDKMEGKNQGNLSPQHK